MFRDADWAVLLGAVPRAAGEASPHIARICSISRLCHSMLAMLGICVTILSGVQAQRERTCWISMVRYIRNRCVRKGCIKIVQLQC